MEFRKMIRAKQQLSQEECDRILREQLRGVLSVNGDGGYPYAMPIDHWYCEENGRIYFHTGLKGHRTDAIRKDDRACYCVYDGGFRKEGDWALNIGSVIVFGRIRPVEDPEWCREIARQLSYKFTDDTEYIENEIRKLLDVTLFLELTPEHMTGKLVNEA